MDSVCVSVPLDLLCPSCENVGVTLTLEVPAELAAGDRIAVATELECPNCHRSVNYGELTGDVTLPAPVGDHGSAIETGGS